MLQRYGAQHCASAYKREFAKNFSKILSFEFLRRFSFKFLKSFFLKNLRKSKIFFANESNIDVTKNQMSTKIRQEPNKNWHKYNF